MALLSTLLWLVALAVQQPPDGAPTEPGAA